MCLILFAYRLHPERPLVVAANRDEYHARPALAAHWWPEDAATPMSSGIFGGRDETAGGTWLAASRDGRLAAVTNWTQDRSATMPASRGDLPHRYLAGAVPGLDFAAAIDGARYAGFNFIGYDGAGMVYASNRTGETRMLEPGVYGLTNTRLGAGLTAAGERIAESADLTAPHPAYEEWPKAVLGARALKEIAATATPDDLIDLLAQPLLPLETPGDREQAPERSYSPCFIRGAEYGTRASTAIVFERRAVQFVEQQYGPRGKSGKRTAARFAIEPSPRQSCKRPQTKEKQ